MRRIDLTGFGIRVPSLLLFQHCLDGTGGDTAVYQQRLPGYIPAGFRREKDHRGVEVAKLAGPFDGDSVAEIFDPFFIVVQHSVLPRENPARTKPITVIPCLPQSSARLMVNWRIPPRLAP